MIETIAKFRGVELVCVSPRVKLELDCLDAQNRTLGDVLEDALTIAARLGWRLVLTCVWRSKAEDRKLKGSGVHPLWRAVDWRTKDVPDAKVLHSEVSSLRRSQEDMLRGRQDQRDGDR